MSNICRRLINAYVQRKKRIRLTDLRNVEKLRQRRIQHRSGVGSFLSLIERRRSQKVLKDVGRIVWLDDGDLESVGELREGEGGVATPGSRRGNVAEDGVARRCQSTLRVVAGAGELASEREGEKRGRTKETAGSERSE